MNGKSKLLSIVAFFALLLSQVLPGLVAFAQTDPASTLTDQMVSQQEVPALVDEQVESEQVAQVVNSDEDHEAVTVEKPIATEADNAGEEAKASEIDSATEETEEKDIAPIALEMEEETVPDAQKAGEISDVIYLNGAIGQDTFDGTTQAQAVKTFAKAKELATAHQTVKRIIVIGITTVSGEVSLAGTNAILVRGDQFNAQLLQVDAGQHATFTNIVIDGNSEGNTTTIKPLIEARDGAVVDINEGTILKNNKNKTSVDLPTRGGALGIFGATLNMMGGLIEGNQALMAEASI
ncbi:hypothetical protein [Allofustis seminis]|uniref:hypothetical protein n=1 Tax=Allofustis seminis TaxID=166939 RepID=UPI00035E10A4|nr:hypothetical protein [Allofustis seminis]